MDKKEIIRSAMKGKGGLKENVKNLGWKAMDMVERGKLKPTV